MTLLDQLLAMTTENTAATGSSIFWIVAIPAVLALLAVVIIRYGRRCFCRKDCCGRGCGCLFPRKR